MSVRARLRMTARFSAPWSLRFRARSSSKTVSRPQWTPFSIVQWARADGGGEQLGRQRGRGEVAPPAGGGAAIALDFWLDHGDGGEAWHRRLVGKAVVGGEPGDVLADGVPARFDVAVVGVGGLAAVNGGFGIGEKRLHLGPHRWVIIYSRSRTIPQRCGPAPSPPSGPGSGSHWRSPDCPSGRGVGATPAPR